MKLRLFHRHFGIHSLIKEIEIPFKFKDAVVVPKNPNDDFLIDEFSILANAPDGFFPKDTKQILLCVGERNGSTAQRHPDFFRPWGKYFDSYSLELSK